LTEHVLKVGSLLVQQKRVLLLGLLLLMLKPSDLRCQGVDLRLERGTGRTNGSLKFVVCKFKILQFFSELFSLFITLLEL
jgi:hypothetical protein